MFRGSLTALIMPFRNGEVDEGAFQRFVDWQIKEGTVAGRRVTGVRMPVQIHLSLALLLLLAAACTNQSGMPGGTLPPPTMTIVAPKEPPPLSAETVPPPPPGPANYFVWEPGHWHWTGQGFIWISGHYLETPYQSGVWVHGGWTSNGGLSWTWTPGHWN